MADKDYGPRIGADPEMFVSLNGQIIPVCGRVGGTKEKPWLINGLVEAVYGPENHSIRRRARLFEDAPEERAPVVEEKHGDYAVQEDNVMLEFNIPAFTGSSSFSSGISKALNIIEANILGPMNLASVVEVAHSFTAEEIAENPQALQIGCMPDFDAYAAEGRFERPPFNAVHFGNNRFCGGHIHVQYNKSRVPAHVFAQFMDLYVNLPFLRYDKQKMRRMFYGQPGIYRDKPYGIEYRTLSNFWLGSRFRDVGNLNMMAENALTLARTANNSVMQLNAAYTKIDWSEVQHAIKTENHKLADEIVKFARDDVGLPIGTAYK